MKTPAPGDKLRYQALKLVVVENIESGFRAWSAIKEIKETKLYLHEFDTWDQFCQSMCKLSPKHVNRMIDAYDVEVSLPKPLETNKKSGPIGSTLTNERQARALAQVEPERRAVVLAQAASSGPVTAASIEKAAKPVIELDKIGREIPKHLVALWNRSDEVQAIITTIQQAVSKLESIEDGKDPLWAGFNIQGAVMELDKIKSRISLFKPYAVCPLCQGHPHVQPGGICRSCRGRGLVGRYIWNAVDEQTKAVIEKGCKR